MNRGEKPGLVDSDDDRVGSGEGSDESSDQEGLGSGSDEIGPTYAANDPDMEVQLPAVGVTASRQKLCRP